MVLLCIRAEHRKWRFGDAWFDCRRPSQSGLGGMLLLVYALVKAPDVGWGTTRTIGELVGAVLLLAGFVANELRVANPLIPLSILRTRGVAVADATQLVAVGGFVPMFFFLTLYMQTVLHYSPIQTGLAYLPLTGGFIISSGIVSQLFAKIGTKPVIVAGAVIVAGGLYWLSRIPVDGSYMADILPGLLPASRHGARPRHPLGPRHRTYQVASARRARHNRAGGDARVRASTPRRRRLRARGQRRRPPGAQHPPDGTRRRGRAGARSRGLGKHRWESRSAAPSPKCQEPARAGGGNRTLITSLEGAVKPTSALERSRKSCKLSPSGGGSSCVAEATLDEHANKVCLVQGGAVRVIHRM